MHSISKVLLSLLVLSSFIGGFENVYEFCYQPYTDISIYTKNDLVEQKGTLDMLFCGTSVAHYAFEPQVFDEKLNANSFNLATSMQPLSGTYHFLLETLETNPVKTVFLGMTPFMLFKDLENIDTEIGVYDKMTTLKGKINYLIDGCQEKNYTNLLFYSTRVKKKGFSIFSKKTIAKNVSYKMTDEYKKNIPPKSSDYVYKGYMGTSEVYDGKLIPRLAKRAAADKSKWEQKKVLKRNKEYLDKIIKLCKDRGVDLNLVIVPVPNIYLEAMDGSEKAMYDYFKQLTDKENIGYYDFNYYNNQEEFTNDCFKDYKHMNTKGAEKFSAKLAEIYKADEKGQAIKKYFKYE